MTGTQTDLARFTPDTPEDVIARVQTTARDAVDHRVPLTEQLHDQD